MHSLFILLEAIPTQAWDSKKLESIDNKSLGPINISDQSRVDVRVCWVFAFSIFSKKKCLSHNHFTSQEIFMDLSKTWCAMCWWRATWGYCMFELFSEHTFCWLFDTKHSVPGMLNSLDMPTFWYPWDFCFRSMHMLKYPHPDSNKYSSLVYSFNRI
jgi:hypothetical protein